MAQAVVENTQIKLQFDAGLVDGKQKYKSKTLSNVKENVTDDAILAVSNAANALTSPEVLKTLKVVTTSIEA